MEGRSSFGDLAKSNNRRPSISWADFLTLLDATYFYRGWSLKVSNESQTPWRLEQITILRTTLRFGELDFVRPFWSSFAHADFSCVPFLPFPFSGWLPTVCSVPLESVSSVLEPSTSVLEIQWCVKKIRTVALLSLIPFPLPSHSSSFSSSTPSVLSYLPTSLALALT